MMKIGRNQPCPCGSKRKFKKCCGGPSKESSTVRKGVSILKTIWAKRPDGQWVIHDIKGIELKPRAGYSNEYFKIENQIELLTQRPGAILQDLMTSFGPTEFLLKQSIVPVIAWNKGDKKIRCIGTAFFISCSGYLMTAGHVMRDPQDSNYAEIKKHEEGIFKIGDDLTMGVLIPINPAAQAGDYIMCPIEKCWFWGGDKESPLFNEKPRFEYATDIAVFKIPPHPSGGAYQPLNLSLHPLKNGDRAFAIGYAEMEDIPLSEDGKKHGKFNHELTVSVGTIQDIYHDNHINKKAMTSGPCFSFDAKIPGKMSGSPIFTGDGVIVKGIVSTSFQDDNLAHGCTIAPAMQLEMRGEVSLLELMRNGNEGMAQIEGADL